MDSKYPWYLLLLAFALKLLYPVIAWGLSELGIWSHDFQFTWTELTQLGLRKDGYWYRAIALNGYDPGPVFETIQSSWAFFPAYPKTVGWISNLLGTSYTSAAFWCSLLLTPGWIILGYRYFRDYWQNERKATFTVALIILWPWGYHLSMYLTEASFLLCFLGGFGALHKKKGWLAGLIFVPLVLLRPNGLMLLLPAWLYWLERHEVKVFQFWKKSDAWRGVLRLLPPVLAFAGYCAYQYHLTGDALAFATAQAGWGKEFVFPTQALFRQGNLNAQITSTYVLLASIFVGWNWRRLPASLLVLVALSILLPLTAGSTFGCPRYLSVVFPIFLLLADQLPQRNWLLVLLAILHLVTFFFWVLDWGIGF